MSNFLRRLVCHPICGDGIIQGQEQCDNLINLVKNANIHVLNIVKFVNLEFAYNVQMDLQLIPILIGTLKPYSVEQCELTFNGVQDSCQDFKFISIPN
ncbi:unnamed protein product (macronuclear) [Paramecium tetraurelia]|uniref:Uncharacterized protein n=1 Tax=Paramecium tetraurelia TaxID=5888 RepID=A0D139_PARTE|nr:uncharacterized protein GSPATT00039171001 [Paramecium tetraurelia]CAK76756.1 unnamed protein product [Paramecium tetraurelia]|eukprot:XP_001444153.1 hypothetical protein (macronuclear) [Paramecium tetraurelia strain d4-2]